MRTDEIFRKKKNNKFDNLLNFKFSAINCYPR